MGIYRKYMENLQKYKKYLENMKYIGNIWKIYTVEIWKIYRNVENCVLDGLRWAATTPTPPGWAAMGCDHPHPTPPAQVDRKVLKKKNDFLGGK